MSANQRSASWSPDLETVTMEVCRRAVTARSQYVATFGKAPTEFRVAPITMRLLALENDAPTEGFKLLGCPLYEDASLNTTSVVAFGDSRS
jgi:hypothetical protein